MIGEGGHGVTRLSALCALKSTLLVSSKKLLHLGTSVLDHIMTTRLLLEIKLPSTPLMRAHIIGYGALKELRVRSHDMYIKGLLLSKLPLTSCGRTFMLEGSTVLGRDVHMDSTLIRLGVVTVRALERTAGALGADVFVGHCEGDCRQVGGGGFNF